MISSGCTHTSNAFNNAHFAQVHQRHQHIEHLENQITELAAHIDAAMFRLLELVREYDEGEGTGGEAEIEDGGNIAAETARRLSCDAGLVHWLDTADGEPLSIGRKSRTIPPAIRRALQRRDGGCRFPGCTCSRFVDAHHIQHWADGGETAMENLVLLCRHHHRLVHEGGFGIGKSTLGAIQFTSPAGELIPTGPDTRSRGNFLALFDTHAHCGIRITPKTAQSQWLGETMDDDMAIQVMLQLQ